MTYKPYKMGGPSLYRSAPGKYAAPLKQPKVTETWEEPTTTTTVKKNDKGGENTTVNTNQKGKKTTYTPPSKTPEGDKAYKALTPSQRKAQDDKYIKSNTKTKPLEKNSSDTKSTKKPKETKCKCQTYKADGSKGPMVTHECGKPNANCSKRPTTKTCSCTPKGGEPITYDCGKAKPAACASKGSSTECPDSKRQSCPGSSWSWKKCKCLKRPNDNKSSGRVKKRCFKGSKLAECGGSDGGIKGGGRTM
jgi:hypothetical protein